MSQRKLIAFLLLICMVIAMPLAVFAEETAETQSNEAIATNTVTDGFVDNGDGTYSYYVNGEMVTAAVVLHTDGCYYAFDGRGIMYVDTAFSLYNYDMGAYEYYRAKENGALYVNEWYYPNQENSPYNRYYYGEGGRALNGIKEVDGVLYAFYSDGQVCRNARHIFDGVYYISDDEGICHPLNTDGWTQVGEDWYYCADGEPYTDGVYEIGAAYYGFNYNGRMYVNQLFSLYDEDLGRSVYYRAKENGELYVNEWYYPYPDSEYEGDRYYRFYYGEGGKAPKGLMSVEGVTYYFDYDGEALRNYRSEIDGVTYITDSTGVAYVLDADGWYQISDNWYYVLEGKLCADGVYLIGESYYGFDYSGRMRVGQEFDLYDDELERWVYYRAKENGELYVNEWYYPNPENDPYYCFYYGEGGKAPVGLTEVNDVQYYFYSNGCMGRNYSFAIDGVNYVLDEFGTVYVLETDGWHQIGEEWYYVLEGELCIDGVYEINGSYYLFASSGVMYMDETASFYDYDLGRWVYYRAKENGELYVNEWYLPNPENEPYYRYYYGEGGKAAYGLTEVDGILYYFYSDGQMRRNCSVVLDDVTYIVDSTGVVHVLAENGWHQIDEDWYYVQDSVLLKEGVYQIGGSYYGFDYYGQMYADQCFDFWNEDQGRWVYYRAKENGELYVNEWYYPDPMNDPYYRFYYGEGGEAPSGLQIVDGQQYYFYNDGRPATNCGTQLEDGCYYADETGALTKMEEGWNEFGSQVFYVSNGQFPEYGVNEIDGAYYWFYGGGSVMRNSTMSTWDNELERQVYYRAREDGRLYVNEWYAPNSSSASNKYYYGEGGKSAYGYQVVDGVAYYFRYNGRIYVNTLFQLDGTYYVADETGAVTNVSLVDGWISVGESWYYISGGELYANGIYSIGGALYGFDSDGRMFENGSFEMYDGETDDWYYYRAKENGELYVNAWYEAYDGEWYYYGNGGRAVRDLQTIGSFQYYFDWDGRMYTDALIRLGGDEYYAAGKNGRLTPVVMVEGWNKVNSDWYYVLDGTIVEGRVIQIGNTYYAFRYDGRMYCDGWFNLYDSETGDDSCYWAKATGALCENEWIQDEDGNWYYYGEGGKAVPGVQTIGNYKYCFSWEGAMICESLVNDDGQNYYADINGRLTKLNADGWTQVGSDWFYARDGYVYSNEIVEVNSVLYYLNYDGKMVSNDCYEIRVYNEENDYWEWVFIRAQANGALYRNTWYYGDTLYSGQEGWQYYGNDGTMMRNEVAKIGKYYYHFNNNGLATSNDIICFNGVTYVFDANTNGTVAADGWHTHPKNGNWMYVEDGVLAVGLKNINGSRYGFDDAGYMMENRVFFDENSGKYYLLGDSSKGSAAAVTKIGWHTIQGRYVYVTSEGTLAEGWLTLGGTSYYMGPNMYSNTIFYDEEGVCYVAAGNGACTKVTSDGLYSINAGDILVYVENGQVVTNEWRAINGEWYYFGDFGMYTSNTYWIDDALYLFDRDGKMYTDGWLMLNGDYYYSTNGRAAVGLQTIGGKQYYFADYGRMLVDRSVQVDGKWYVIGIDGVVLGQAKGNGWQQFGDNWYYLEDGHLCRSALIRIDGSLYYFDNYGVMAANEMIWWDGAHYFGSNGAAVTGWYKTPEGWVYANENGLLYEQGKYTIGNATYYFRDCYLKTGTFRWNDTIVIADSNGNVKDSFAIPSGWTYVEGEALYYVDGEPYTGWVGDRYINDGYMCMNGVYMIDDGYRYFDVYGKTLKNGWMEVYEDVWLLAKADGTLYDNEWAYINGTYYYFMDFVMLYDGVWEIDGILYEFDENGKYVGIYEIENNTGSYSDGWHYIDGEYYYGHAGELVQGRQYINGKWYYFDWDGCMVSNGIYYDEFNDSGWYYYDASGAMVEYAGWKQLHGYWHYFNTDHTVRSGWLQDGDKLYYMVIDYVKCSDGVRRYVSDMYTGYMSYDLNLYYFGSDGVCQGKITSVHNGWYQAGDEWYYFKHGKLINGYHIIDGIGYCFEAGRMEKNIFCWTDRGVIYIDSNGHQVTAEGWYYLDDGVYEGYWIYVNDQGTLCNGVWEIDGKLYYFSGHIWVG